MEPLIGILAVVVAGLIVMVLIFAALSWSLSLIAAPKGADLTMLTSGHEGEALIDFRVANALIKDASPNFAFDFILEQVGGQMTSLAVSTTLKVMGQMMDGLWVGGRIFLTTHRVVFMPNGMNRALQDGLEIVSIDLARILAVPERFGMVTRIADIETAAGKLSFRGWKTSEFVSRILAAREARL